MPFVFHYGQYRDNGYQTTTTYTSGDFTVTVSTFLVVIIISIDHDHIGEVETNQNDTKYIDKNRPIRYNI